MAQITFLATDQDCETLWDIILVEMGLKAAPDPWFGNVPVPTLSTPADVAANLNEYPRVAPGLSYFLTSPEWSVEPLVHHLCKDNPTFAPHWYASPRAGGPSIIFVPSFAYPWHKKPDRIIAGMFSDYPYYYSAADAGKIIERPDGLARAMKTIGQRLRSHGKTVRAATGERAIAMRNALEAHQEGVILRAGDIVYSPIASGRRIRRCT